MNRKFMNFAAVGIGILGLAGLNSCLKVDDTYDLEKDFDMTITVGGDLSVPGSSTEKILLGDLLDLEEDGIIKVNEGEYHLVQNGEKTSTQVNVPGVDIDVSGTEFKGFSTQIKEVPSGGTIPSTITGYLNDKIEINISQGDIPEELVSLSHATTEMVNTSLDLTQTSGANVKLLSGYTIAFPEYMEIEYTGDDGVWEVTGEGDNKNVLKLVSADGFTIGGDSKIYFGIAGISFKTVNGQESGENEQESNYAIFNNESQVISINDNIALNGQLSVSGTISGSGITIKGNVTSQSIVLSDVTGIVSPKVDIEKNSITLDDMPDFLSDDNVILDLTDPRIYVTLTNPTPVKVEIGGTLTSMKGDDTNNKKSVDITTFEIPSNQEEDYVVCINQIKDGPEDDINYVKVDNLSSIIEKIPDQIEMEITANAVEENMTVKLNQEYTIKTDYKIDTPLSFGPKTNITYTETIDGWDADLEDAEFKEVKVSMTVINEIPLGVKLNAEAIDVNGNTLDNVKLIMDETTVTPGNIGNPSNKELSFSIVSNGSIKGLDGIKISIVGFVNENAGNALLKENQTMRFTDIKLTLKGGITMDLN